MLFFVFCYVPWWFTCPIGTAAAQNDIAFYKIVCNYEKIYEVINKAVKESFKFHQWYIIPESIPLKLFDEGLDRCDKDNLAKTILSYPQEESNTRTDIGYGKPRFWRKVPENITDADFLNTSSDTWNNDQSYLKGLPNSKHIKVCNDLAERAIKLTQDYCHHILFN